MLSGNALYLAMTLSYYYKHQTSFSKCTNRFYKWCLTGVDRRSLTTQFKLIPGYEELSPGEDLAQTLSCQMLQMY